MTRLKRSIRTRRGYTVVEVMSAMTLFAIGAAGVISMQRVTIQGGEDARRLDLANNIAHEWAFRLQRDAGLWTQPSTEYPTTNNIASATEWLRIAPTDNTQGIWTTPALAAGAEAGRSGFFDLWGRDRPVDSNDHVFCAQYRLKWITLPASGTGPLNTGALLRVEVRVFYPRLEQGLFGACGTASPDDAVIRQGYHFVQIVTAVRPNPEPARL